MAALHTDIFQCSRPRLRRFTYQRRAFTTSPGRRKHGALPTFYETPSEQLNALLSTFRKNIFLPAHLIHLQKDLIYKRKNWPLITSDEPATVRLGDEVVQLHPLDRMKDEPRTWPSLNKVLTLMRESGDWRNLRGLLEGFKDAKRRLSGERFEKVVRKVNEAGKMGVIMDCLQRVDRTDLGLWNVGVAREVMRGAIVKAMHGGWSQKAVESGVQYAEFIVEMMWDPRHTKSEGESPKWQPDILGVLLQLHATQAVLFGEGKGGAGMVQKYSRTVLEHWENVDLKIEDGDWTDANIKMVQWIPVRHGIQMARKVLGEESLLGRSLGQRVEQKLEPMLQKAQRMLEGKIPESGKRRGLVFLEGFSSVCSK